MPRRKRAARAGTIRIIAVGVALVLAAGLLWLGYRQFAGSRATPRSDVPVAVGADHIDPANDARRVIVSGTLSAAGSARDRDFGTGTKAAMLFRKVEMLQWQEHCAGAECSYDKAWAATAIDSHKFRVPAGHENPPLRLVSARFDAPNMHLGLFEVDPALIEAQLPSVEHPMHAAELPPNLAATFSESAGLLYAGGDPTHPDIGTVRIGFREIPFGAATLSGTQRGKHLTH